MSAQADLFKSLRIAGELPEVITALQIELRYAPDALQNGLPEDRLEEVTEMLEYLGLLLQAGFLSRPFTPQSRIQLEAQLPEANLLRLRFRGAGQHCNLIPLLLRMLHGLHQTPADAFAELVAALDSEDRAREVFEGIDYARTVLHLAVAVQGAEGAALQPASPDQARRGGVPLPASGPLSPERVIEAEAVRVMGLPEGLEVDDDLENAFLTVAMTGAFLPLDHDPYFDPGEAETWTDGDVLQIDDVAMEQAFLFEWINMLSGGGIAALRLEMQE